MKSNTTELVFILDRSGSMAGMEADTIGGFNAMLEKQKALEGTAYLSTVLFANESCVLHDRAELSEVEPLTEREYQVGGGTALFDAIGGAIRHIGNVHKYARPEDVPEHTVFFITTDGMENASRVYGREEIKRMIRRQQEKYGWEFVFIAANIDAAETAEKIGIKRDRSANYRCDSNGTAEVYNCMNEIALQIRSSAEIDPDWAKRLNTERENQ